MNDTLNPYHLWTFWNGFQESDIPANCPIYEKVKKSANFQKFKVNCGFNTILFVCVSPSDADTRYLTQFLH